MSERTSERATAVSDPRRPVPTRAGVNARAVELAVRNLCEAEHVFSPRRREHLVNNLPNAVRRNVDTAGPPAVFARDLLWFCVRRNLVGCLVRWLVYMEDGGRSARAVARSAAALIRQEECELLGRQFPDMEDEDVDAVREELFPISFDEVRGAYEHACPPRFDFPTPPPATAWDALIDLAEITTPTDGAPPLAVFCSAVGHRLRAARADLLDALVGGVEPASPAPLSGAGSGCAGPARLVVLVGGGARRGRFHVEHWTVLSTRRGEEPVFCGHGVSQDLHPGVIGEHVAGLLTRLEADPRTHHHNGRRVELVAPLPLLNRLRAERWQEAAADGTRLGARAEVVYRAEELVSAGARGSRDACGKRWKKLERSGEALALDVSHEREEYEEPLAERCKDDSVLVLLIPSHLDHWYTHVWTAITLGVPVVVWSSADNGPGIGSWLNPGRMGREINVSSERIRSLPQVLYSCRSGRVLPGDTGYIEKSFEVAVMYHDPLPVLPEPPSQMSTDSIR